MLLAASELRSRLRHNGQWIILSCAQQIVNEPSLVSITLTAGWYYAFSAASDGTNQSEMPSVICVPSGDTAPSCFPLLTFHPPSDGDRVSELRFD